jgi:uncharacterized membrane protein YtjA (UPF0391 family)
LEAQRPYSTLHLRIQLQTDAANHGVQLRLSCKLQEGNMLYWAVVFFVIALVAALLGFTGVAIAAAGIAKIVFFIFLVLFLISLVTHLGRGTVPR